MYTTQLDLFLVLLALQHVIVFGARIVIFLCLYVSMMSCESGPDFPENYQFDNLIISYHYIKY